MSKKNVFVSVIINCHNGEKYLKEAIDSVYLQTYSNWEIVFWDNNSTDNSSKIAEQYDKKLKYFKGDKFISLYRARNFALDLCKGDAIAFLDCDDIWLPYKLENQVEYLTDKYPLIYGGYEMINEKGESLGIRKNQNFKGKITNILLKRNLISIGCVLVKAKLLKEFRFDPFYELLGDFDLWIRLSVKYNFLAISKVQDSITKISQC